MENILEKYNLEKMIEVVGDRLDDYSDIQEEYEESYVGEQETHQDKYYEYGYGKILEDVVTLLNELKDHEKMSK